MGQDQRGDPEDRLRELVDRLRRAAGSNLQSVILYGSGARNELGRHSDLNVLCLLRDLHGPELDKVSAVIAWWSKEAGQRPPLFMTVAELQSSADVFAIESLDLKAHHRVLHGEDIVASLEVPMTLHRVQLEHELRTVLLRLRQHYLLARDNETELRAVLAKSVSSVTTLLRHVLIAAGQTSGSKEETLAKINHLFGVNVGPFQAAIEIRHQSSATAQIHGLYLEYVEALAEVVEMVDKGALDRAAQNSKAGEKKI